MSIQSEVCGFEAETFEELERHEAEHEVMISAGGHGGQFLSPAFVFDVASLVGEDKIPADVRAAAKAWLDSQFPSDSEVTVDEVDVVLDWVMYTADGLLSDAGFMAYWDDGYMIFRECWEV